ncbi:hypothetical protein Peur_020978 [Populus x canadensis]
MGCMTYRGEEDAEVAGHWLRKREKEQEFLELKLGDLTVLEYERRFQDLAAFASTYLPTERHRGMERVIKDTPKPVVEQSQAMGAKRRDFEFITGRPPLPKKGKSGPSSGQFQRRVKDPICASRQGLGGSTSIWESKRDQGEGKPGYRDIISNVIRWANSYG